ncbi:hypothetical protein K432DRAFT_439275 [Lepidopterella palustris CBS 459.81]|uniref:Uncharacterized protein n=1 Tax=Lepidopterella palustris CBS 459.81 TaxID=1314670 RepID=A0A8E2JK52_9PEZI|nr:hypothetical protein K432DRAFT_439275 [Lepidopterella palustris CBS 459.81]
MASLIKAIVECLKGPSEDDILTNEKIPKNFIYKGGRTAKSVAADVLATLYSAEKADSSLEKSLKNTVGECGWTQNVAEAILNGLANALRNGAAMGGAMRDAFEKANPCSYGFRTGAPSLLHYHCDWYLGRTSSVGVGDFGIWGAWPDRR